MPLAGNVWGCKMSVFGHMCELLGLTLRVAFS